MPQPDHREYITHLPLLKHKVTVWRTASGKELPFDGDPEIIKAVKYRTTNPEAILSALQSLPRVTRVEVVCNYTGCGVSVSHL